MKFFLQWTSSLFPVNSIAAVASELRHILSVAGLTLFVCFVATPAIIPSEDEIPVDESDGRDLMATGVLDTALWQLLRPFYRRPVDVPAGELPRLFEVFPELDGFAPASGSGLDRYEPWDEQSVNLFFTEYPLLKRFGPILRFNNHHRGKRTGTVGFHFCQLTDDTVASHTATVTVAPQKWLRFQGAADFTTDYARWERRQLTFNPIPAISVEFGNGTFFQDRGLIFGALPAYRPDGDDILANWLYGESATWNGVAIRGVLPAKKIPCAPQFTCFLHDRPTENIAGGTTVFTLHEHLTILVGASRLSLPGAETSTLYGFGSTKLRRGGFSSDIDFGIEEGRKIRIPLSWRNAIRFEKRSMELLMIHLPQGYNAPLSGLRRSFINEMKFDDTMRTAVTLARFSSENGTGGHFSYAPQIDLWFEDVNVHHGTLRMKGEAKADRFEGMAAFSHDFGGVGDSLLVSAVSAQAEYRFIPPFLLSATGRYSFGILGRESIHFTLSPAILLFGCSRFEPLLSVSAKAQQLSSIVLGLSERTTLFERTYTEFIFKREMVVSSKKEALHVEGRISFVF